MGCTGCLCRRRTTQSYEPVPESESGSDMDELNEILVIVRNRSRIQPVHLALTTDALVVVKHKRTPRVIPYLSLLSVDLDSADSNSLAISISISALVPSNRDDPLSESKLWNLEGQVQPSPSHTVERIRSWAQLALSRAYSGVERDRTFHVVVNPIGGKGLAKRAWQQSVKPTLDAARVKYKLSYTGPKGSRMHAVSLGQRHDSKEFSALIAVSGDGIVHELLNGLAGHDSGKGRKALRETPIVHVPCGSGNALATSIVGNDRVRDWKWCTLVGLKGNPLPIDLCSVTQRGGRRLFSFLTQAFGLMADLDLGTEHLRFLGDLRFTLGYVQGALTRRKYPMRLTVLVENSSKQDIARRYNDSLSTNRNRDDEDNEGDEIPPLEFGDPDQGLGDEVESDMKKKRTVYHLPKDGELDGEGKWWTIDLMGSPPDDQPPSLPPSSSSSSRAKGGRAEKQGGGRGVFFLYGGKMPWISKDVMLFPPALPSSGFIDLCLVAPMSPLEALTAMDSAETGKLYHHPSLLYLQTRAYRLEFPHASSPQSSTSTSTSTTTTTTTRTNRPDDSSRKGKGRSSSKPATMKEKPPLGYVSIDGESIKHESFNVEVHKQLARVMVFDQKLMGSKPIQGV